MHKGLAHFSKLGGHFENHLAWFLFAEEENWKDQLFCGAKQSKSAGVRCDCLPKLHPVRCCLWLGRRTWDKQVCSFHWALPEMDTLVVGIG
jgi:hypothetical protein